MAFEPINIFSRKIDPRGVLEVLRRTGLEVKVAGPDDDWTEAVVTVRKGGLLRKAVVMTFGHNSEYYDGDGWPRQVMGMQGYFSRFADVPRKPDIMRAIGLFRFALSVPQDDLNIESDDERLKLLYAVCSHLDGVIFTPSSLRDAQGRILISSDGEFDPQAELPKLPAAAEVVATAPNINENEDAGDTDSAEEDDYPEPVPPLAVKVARRALALTAVAARATLELDAEQLDSPEELRKRLTAWLESLDIGDELEPQEWKVLQRPVGTLEQQDFINAMWRVEGLAVLAWALGLCEMPPDDELVVPMELYGSLGFLDTEAARAILASPELRPAAELEEMRIHLLMLHWRIRDYSIKPEAMDFVAFSQNCWIGSFDISRFRIIDRDLAVGDTALHDADDERKSIVASLAMERHLAINWLSGYSAVYSETDTGT